MSNSAIEPRDVDIALMLLADINQNTARLVELLEDDGDDGEDAEA